MRASPLRISPKRRFSDSGSEAESTEVLFCSHTPGETVPWVPDLTWNSKEELRTLRTRRQSQGPWGTLRICLSLKRVVPALRKTSRHPHLTPQPCGRGRGLTASSRRTPPPPLPATEGKGGLAGLAASLCPVVGGRAPASHHVPPKAASCPQSLPGPAL